LRWQFAVCFERIFSDNRYSVIERGLC